MKTYFSFSLLLSEPSIIVGNIILLTVCTTRSANGDGEDVISLLNFYKAQQSYEHLRNNSFLLFLWVGGALPRSLSIHLRNYKFVSNKVVIFTAVVE